VIAPASGEEEAWLSAECGVVMAWAGTRGNGHSALVPSLSFGPAHQQPPLQPLLPFPRPPPHAKGSCPLGASSQPSELSLSSYRPHPEAT
jgi:hypothetical protein